MLFRSVCSCHLFLLQYLITSDYSLTLLNVPWRRGTGDFLHPPVVLLQPPTPCRFLVAYLRWMDLPLANLGTVVLVPPAAATAMDETIGGYCLCLIAMYYLVTFLNV